ncbi:UDP-N-acetylmuramoyl-L-alanyl-D-glutamate--2,6-diaminopimelate ligase [Algicola sagamiensis]|uniref:UDP-N-acetylmuramoyl-L-alanyl-D-glutamate--2, 6-diaminopimelate ligase n=1 Tax=Algicola sagamiensis TaxID=163869 RepID=UPI000380659D|nr:UDP-N-acetylmuramoyl-L-alanyl-D-glutamate--2,6-diaminopimelate ligase [Algicola sagamiensis]
MDSNSNIMLQQWLNEQTTADTQLPEIAHLRLDSRAIQPGDAFIAIKGTALNGHDFINQAAAEGASIVFCEYQPEDVDVEIPLIVLPALKLLLPELCNVFYQTQQCDLRVIGVTGTNGKTSVTQLITQCLNRALRQCQFIGTNGYGDENQVIPLKNTTPSVVELHQLLAEFRAKGCQVTAMEVSSHGITQNRIGGLSFKTAIFTNLSREHLDFHGDMASYAAAKQELFQREQLENAVIYTDDPVGKRWVEDGGVRADNIIAVGAVETTADQFENFVSYRAPRFHSRGVSFELLTSWGNTRLQSPLLGEFNIVNLCLVAAALLVEGVCIDDLPALFNQTKTVVGRMESIMISGSPLVIVDYAHTPDALEKALAAARKHCRNQLICVFGCGGDRDKGKRPLMGEVAERFSDAVIVTSDNPRSESIEQISKDILAGFSKLQPIVVDDREAAIEKAVELATEDDVILIAGKGHEDYQIIGEQVLEFDDRKVVRCKLARVLEETASD